MPIRECCPPPLDARLLPALVAGYRPRPFLAGAVETSYLSLARANVQNRIAILLHSILYCFRWPSHARVTNRTLGETNLRAANAKLPGSELRDQAPGSPNPMRAKSISRIDRGRTA